MRKYILLLFMTFLFVSATWAQPVVKFVKPHSSFMRKPGVTTQLVSLTASNITPPQEITIRRLNNSGDGIKLHDDPTKHTFLALGSSQWSVIIDVSDDTTKKDEEIHTLELTYIFKDAAGNSADKTEIHGVKLTAFREETPSPEIVRDDFLLFAGSNFDPANEGATLNNFSFESIFKVNLGGRFHMRLGGFSNRNFSIDSATSLPRINYVNTKPDVPLKVDTSQLAVQRYTLDSRSTTRSAGLYADLFFTLIGQDRKDLRISVAGHVEYVRRRIVPTISFVNIGDVDTVSYNKSLADQLRNQRIAPQNSLVSNENVFVPRRNIDQYYGAIGIAIEKSTKLFDIFFQPFIGGVYNTLRYSHRPNQTLIAKYWTLGIKAQATIKLLDATLAIDLKDINTSSPYTNISVGIPVSGKKLVDLIKEIK